MKKFYLVALAGILTMTLAACGNSAGQELQVQEETTAETQESNVEEAATEAAETQDAEEETAQTAETESAESASEQDTEEVEEEAMTTGSQKVLVAYFSWSGSTRQLAEMIQGETGGDLFEIVPETAYTEDYNELLDVAQQEKSENARPALAAHVDNWDEYDTIFVGYPNWWSDAPRVVLSFLEEYDCTGKTIIPFCTSGGGGFGGSQSSVAGSASGATMVDGFHVNGSSVGSAGADVAAWVDGLNLAE